MLVVHNQELFGRFLQDSDGHPKHKTVKKMKAVQTRMSWRTTDNITDCGTLCMQWSLTLAKQTNGIVVSKRMKLSLQNIFSAKIS